MYGRIFIIITIIVILLLVFQNTKAGTNASLSQIHSPHLLFYAPKSSPNYPGTSKLDSQNYF